MATTPICNPHICTVLLGTVGYFGVLWGAVGYCGGTVGLLWVLWGYNEVLCGTVRALQGTAWYCWLLLVTTWYWGVLGGTGVHWGVNRGTGGSGFTRK